MKSEKLQGTLYVLLGAMSYGVLATIVKYANGLGIHTSVLTFFQFLIGSIVLISIFIANKAPFNFKKISAFKLMAWGSSLGLTSTLYYLAIQYIPVSVGIILLMQSIWMSLVLEIILTKKWPQTHKIIGALVCILGTLLATNIFDTQIQLDWRGLTLGFGSGISFSITMFASNSVEKQLPSYTRSMFMVLGGLMLICTFWNFKIAENMSIDSIYWGAALALFGTILPPLFFTKGFPKTGIGMGSIISSAEIPVSIASAFIILQESISPIQWVGVFCILSSVIIVNLKSLNGA